MATIYKDVEVEVKINTEEIWEEVLDNLSTEEIEEYLQKRRKNKTPALSIKEAERDLLDIATLRLSPNLLCCKDSVKKTINEIMDELWS